MFTAQRIEFRALNVEFSAQRIEFRAHTVRV